MKTVLPSNEPLYLLKAWKAVIAASGSDAASLNDKFLGLSAT
jgi:hypothetical protein